MITYMDGSNPISSFAGVSDATGIISGELRRQFTQMNNPDHRDYHGQELYLDY